MHAAAERVQKGEQARQGCQECQEQLTGQARKNQVERMMQQRPPHLQTGLGTTCCAFDADRSCMQKPTETGVARRTCEGQGSRGNHTALPETPLQDLGRKGGGKPTKDVCWEAVRCSLVTASASLSNCALTLAHHTVFYSLKHRTQAAHHARTPGI